MVERTVDVLVVGGGIAGCAAAYFLSQQGSSVLLFEKDSVAGHASGFAFGVLLPRLFDNPSNPADELTALSLRLHKQITDELSKDGEVLRREKASVLLALNEQDADQYRGLYRSQSSLIGDVRWLEYGELSHVEARISPDIPGGLYLGDAAEISPAQFTNAMWNAAESNGAKLIREEVQSVAADGTSGVKVIAGNDTYSAGQAIVAAGPWSSRLLETVDVTVPIEPLKGQIVRTRAPGPPMRVSLWWDSDYAGSKPDGLLWCGTTEERVGFDEQTTDSARDGILASARRVLPFLSDAEIVTQTACLRPVTADGLPVVGSLTDHSNIIVASGGGRNGIVLGPALGKVAADIAIGSDSGIDAGFLSPARFRA